MDRAQERDDHAMGYPVDQATRDWLESIIRTPLPFWPGSEIHHCCRCGQETYIGPRVSLLVSLGMPVLCILCAVREGVKLEDVKHLGSQDDPYAQRP